MASVATGNRPQIRVRSPNDAVISSEMAAPCKLGNRVIGKSTEGSNGNPLLRSA
jgi:hypothetical protein